MAMFGRKTTYGVTLNRKDNRRSARRNINAQAVIRLSGGFAARPCTVLDLSDTGARLVVERPQEIPNEFTLMLSRRSEGRTARVKWRRGTQFGVEFA